MSLVLGLIGWAVIATTSATTYIVDSEAEAGVAAGNASMAADSTASGSQAVKFGGNTLPPIGYVVNLTDYGAMCDGTFNDRPALQQAVDAVSTHGGGTVMVPAKTCRIVQDANSVFTTLPSNVTIRGESSAATLALDSDVKGAFRELFRVYGASNISFETINMVRVSDVYGIFVDLYGVTGLSFNNVTMDGHKDTIGGADIHGIAVFGSAPTKVSNVSMTNTTIKNTDFGMFQDSSVTTIVDGWTVDHSTFTGNYADDLEFNAPNSDMSHITVTNSIFTNNKASDTNAPSGFAIGFANVQHGTIKGNTISGYQFDPIHLEDRTSDVTFEANKVSDAFTSSATNYASHVFIISGAHDIRITGNTFDTAANTNPIDCIYAGPGGASAAPYNISITDNTFKLRPTAQLLGNYGATNVTQSGNITINL
jgi:hypothetical protein